MKLVFLGGLLTTAILPLHAHVQLPGASQPSSAPASGQSPSSTTRSIEGQVLSADGSPVAGAVVLIKDTKTLQVRSYIAQQDGRYHFYGLSMDVNYQLRAQSRGLTSKPKTVSIFNGHPKVVLNLKLTKKLKT